MDSDGLMIDALEALEALETLETLEARKPSCYLQSAWRPILYPDPQQSGCGSWAKGLPSPQWARQVEAWLRHQCVQTPEPCTLMMPIRRKQPSYAKTTPNYANLKDFIRFQVVS